MRGEHTALRPSLCLGSFVSPVGLGVSLRVHMRGLPLGDGEVDDAQGEGVIRRLCVGWSYEALMSFWISAGRGLSKSAT